MAKKTKYVAKKANPDGTVPYTESENQIWKTLYDRQIQILEGRACKEFIDGLHQLKLAANRIPQPSEVSRELQKATGWAVEPVEAVIPADEFFTLLANRRFPAASFIRYPEDLDYIEEPDIFHELFGHCPLITLQPYADFLEAYGKKALASDPKDLKYLFRLFWFTIEFGLIRTDEGIRIFGGGILSSYQETLGALEDPGESFEDFSVETALRTPYRIDMVQPQYFVINDYQTLYDILEDPALDKKIAEAKKLPPILPKKPFLKEGSLVKPRN
ncbi:MAG: phenylalanine 4-monooxygenase [Bdellovibrionales bacterium]|nr:phenylalanine 4-monooxygenase [Bdellovibrionales bacterium]